LGEIEEGLAGAPFFGQRARQSVGMEIPMEAGRKHVTYRL
jgi:hypothetical protein